MEELSDGKLESGSNSHNSEISGDEAEMELANALNSNQDALERLERFKQSRNGPGVGAHRRVDPAGPVQGDDPFWLESFYQLMEKFEGDPSVNNMKKKLALLSGCSGMLAEGWVCKAGLRKRTCVCNV